MHQTATESNELNITLSPPTMADTTFTSRPPPGPGGIKHSDIATFQRQSQNIPAKVEIQAGHSSSKMSDHSLSGYSNRKAASRAKMGSRDTSIVSSRGLGGRMRERERADTNTLTLNSY